MLIGAVIRIGIGVVLLTSGLSGELVLRGTNWSWPVVLLGAGMIAAGVIEGAARLTSGTAKRARLLEVYVPVAGPIGWFRVERGLGVDTCVGDRRALEGIAGSVLADPDEPAFVGTEFLQRSREYASAWPPALPPELWVAWTWDPSAKKDRWVRKAGAAAVEGSPA